jgi:hypothetical protein
LTERVSATVVRPVHVVGTYPPKDLAAVRGEDGDGRSGDAALGVPDIIRLDRALASTCDRVL